MPSTQEPIRHPVHGEKGINVSNFIRYRKHPYHLENWKYKHLSGLMCSAVFHRHEFLLIHSYDSLRFYSFYYENHSYDNLPVLLDYDNPKVPLPAILEDHFPQFFETKNLEFSSFLMWVFTQIASLNSPSLSLKPHLLNMLVEHSPLSITPTAISNKWNSTISLTAIQSSLDKLEKEGWISKMFDVDGKLTYFARFPETTL